MPEMSRVHLTDRVIDLENRTITGGARLSELEAQTLSYLTQHTDRPVSRDELLVEVWGYRPGVRSRAPDTIIKTLRKKLESTPKDPKLLLSVYGKGYRWAGPTAQEDVLPAARGGWPPTAVPLFGREEELSRLREWLDTKHVFVGIIGAPGVGSSRLVQEAVQDREASVFREPPSLREARQLAEQGALLVLDGVVPTPEVSALVGKGLRLVFCARSAPTLPAVRLLPLKPLELDEGLDLLQALCKHTLGQAAPASDAGMRALVEAVGGLPGSLARIAQQLALTPADALLLEIKTHPSDLVGSDNALEDACSNLDPEALTLLEQIVSWPAPVQRGHALQSTGARSATLRRLIQAGLVASWSDMILAPLPVRARITPTPEHAQRARHALYRELLDDIVLQPLSDTKTLQANATLLLAAAESPEISDDDAFEVLWALFEVMDTQGAHRQMLALAERREPAGEPSRSRRLALMATACVRLGSLSRAVELGRMARDSTEALVRLRGASAAGSALAIQGKPQEALAAFEEAASERIAASRLQMVDNIAALRMQLGELQGGLDALLEGVSEARRVGDAGRLASVLTNLTNAFSLLGNAEAAVQHGEEALLLHQVLGDARLSAFDHANLAIACTRLQRSEEARTHVDSARDLRSRFDDPRLERWMDLAEILVLITEKRSKEAQDAYIRFVAAGGVEKVVPGGGEALDALVKGTPPPASWDSPGARVLRPSFD